jgi:O-antigen/teichoic acid export membrane protein
MESFFKNKALWSVAQKVHLCRYYPFVIIMSTIRRQSIISSGIVYFGFALGALTQIFLAKEFSPDQYGLMNGIFVAVGMIMYAFASLGMPAYITKFYPYYNDNLPAKRNDMMSWALLVSFVGFCVVIALGLIFKGPVIRYYSHESAQVGTYYYWIFIFGFGMTVYTVLETFAWQVKLSVLTNYLREVQFRLTTILLIGLYLTGILRGFDLLIKLFAFNYIFIALILAIRLFRTGKLHFVFKVSKVSRRFFSPIRSLALMVWGGQLLFNIAFYFAQIIIAGVVAGGLSAVGVFTFAQFAGSLIQAPQRGVTAAAIGPLSTAWKEKDLGRIHRIYRRSSASLLVFSVGIFLLILLNFTDGILTFHLKTEYLAALPVFFFIGLARLVDMGTGVNTQIIGTSLFWRFDFISGIILVTLTLPLNYVLAKKLGIIGPAIADLITFAVYNGIRWWFLFHRFQMQPFTRKTLYTLILGAVVWLVCHLLFASYQGLFWMIARSLVFLVLYGSGVLSLKLSEDVLPVWQTIRKRLGLGG